MSLKRMTRGRELLMCPPDPIRLRQPARGKNPPEHPDSIDWSRPWSGNIGAPLRGLAVVGLWNREWSGPRHDPERDPGPGDRSLPPRQGAASPEAYGQSPIGYWGSRGAEPRPPQNVPMRPTTAFGPGRCIRGRAQLRTAAAAGPECDDR